MMGIVVQHLQDHKLVNPAVRGNRLSQICSPCPKQVIGAIRADSVNHLLDTAPENKNFHSPVGVTFGALCPHLAPFCERACQEPKKRGGKQIMTASK